MDNKLLNRAITISAREDKLQGGKLVAKIKDEKGLTYTVYKTKQDGSVSIAWDQLQELSIGETVQIGYVEEIKNTEQYGTVTYRTIRNFNKDIGNGVQNARGHQNSSTPESPRSGQNNASGRGSNDAFGQRLTLHGMVNGMLASGKSPAEVEDCLGELLKLEDAIDRALKTPSDFLDDDLPTGEEMDVSDMSF